METKNLEETGNIATENHNEVTNMNSTNNVSPLVLDNGDCEKNDVPIVVGSSSSLEVEKEKTSETMEIENLEDTSNIETENDDKETVSDLTNNISSLVSDNQDCEKNNYPIVENDSSSEVRKEKSNEIMEIDNSKETGDETRSVSFLTNTISTNNVCSLVPDNEAREKNNDPIAENDAVLEVEKGKSNETMEIDNSGETGDKEIKSDGNVTASGPTNNVCSLVPVNETNEKNDVSIVESISSLEVGKQKANKGSPLQAGALSAIAMDYNSSDSESEEVTEIPQNLEVEIIGQERPIEILKEYRANTKIMCSSDEDDSEDDSSSSEESQDSESDSSSESSEEETSKDADKQKNQKTKNTSQRCRKEDKGEFDDLPPIEDLQINVPEVLCEPLGEVAWIVDQMVVVHPKPGKPTLNFDSILFVERGRRVLGRVFDVFGQVSDPHYCVRFNDSKHIEENKIQVGMSVYFCPNTEYTNVVFLHELIKMKASDPTDHDEAPEFSDDEEEQAYYQNLRKQQKSGKADSGSEVPNKRKRNAHSKSETGKKSGWQAQHPWNTRRNPRIQHQGNEQNQQNSNDSQVPCTSQNWYGSQAYQRNPWPSPWPSPFQNPGWPMMYPPQPYGAANNFRPQVEFRPRFQPPRNSNFMNWNVRNPSQSPQNLRTESTPAGNAFSVITPPPPPPGV